jgi:hypothetical protein
MLPQVADMADVEEMSEAAVGEGDPLALARAPTFLLMGLRSRICSCIP